MPDGRDGLPGRLVGGLERQRDIDLRREEHGHIRQRIAHGDRLEEDLGAGEPDIRNTSQGLVGGQSEIALATSSPDRAVDAVRNGTNLSLMSYHQKTCDYGLDTALRTI